MCRYIFENLADLLKATFECGWKGKAICLQLTPTTFLALVVDIFPISPCSLEHLQIQIAWLFHFNAFLWTVERDKANERPTISLTITFVYTFIVVATIFFSFSRKLVLKNSISSEFPSDCNEQTRPMTIYWLNEFW